MKVYEEKFDLRMPKSHGRSKGLHVSEVIRDYALCCGVLDRKYARKIDFEDDNTNLMQIGLGWEDYLANYQHPEIEFHPGEWRVEDETLCGNCGIDRDCHKADGCDKFVPLTIFMSPDGASAIDPEDYGDLFAISKSRLFLHEFKFTRKSSRNFARSLRMKEKKALMWLWQIMSYCKAMDTLAAKLHVMFINGNYSRDDKDPESQPSYKIFRLHFAQEDIDKNWNLIRNHARTMICR